MPPEADPQESTTLTSKSESQMPILIVDDSTTNIVLMSVLASSVTDRQAVTFEDPTEALQWCQVNQPALVLVDYQMPGLSGTEFIALLRQIPQLRSVPIMMVTTENTEAVRHEAFKLGANAFLAKPINATEFRQRVHTLLT